MEKEELNKVLSETIVTEEHLVAEVYFILKNDDTEYLKFVDIEEKYQNELTSQFVGTIEKTIINNEELDVINISSADERKNVIYEYDLDEHPDELIHMNNIIENEDIEYFSFSDDNLKDIYGILILIVNNDNTLVLYKKHYPVCLYRKDGFSIKRMNFGNDKRFTRLEDDILRLNSSFQFFSINKNLFIRDLKILEKFFGFHKVIENKARNCLERIKTSKILFNPDELESMIDDITFARKLTKVISSSPVLDKVKKNVVIKFTKNNPALKGKFEYNNQQIVLGTKKSKNTFVKLLNDDYLVSELTKQYYDSLAKDRID